MFCVISDIYIIASKKIKDLLLKRDVENKFGHIADTAALARFSRLFWPWGALTEQFLSPLKPADLVVSLLLCTVEPYACNLKTADSLLKASQ